MAALVCDTPTGALCLSSPQLKSVPLHCLRGLRFIYSQLEALTCCKCVSTLEVSAGSEAGPGTAPWDQDLVCLVLQAQGGAEGPVSISHCSVGFFSPRKPADTHPRVQPFDSQEWSDHAGCNL